MSDCREAQQISQTLARLSSHLDVLAGQLFHVEEALGQVLSSPKRNEGVSVTEFQSLDFARQSLEDCALMLHILSQDPSAEAEFRNTLTAKEKLKLEATRRLLTPQSGNANSISSGEIDLF
jgi:hypothetical protein